MSYHSKFCEAIQFFRKTALDHGSRLAVDDDLKKYLVYNTIPSLQARVYDSSNCKLTTIITFA